MEFDPDAAATPDSGIFGLPHGPRDAYVHVLPVPYEATTSYRGGTSLGPEAILAASHQVDLFDLETNEPWRRGIWMAPIDERVAAWSRAGKALAAPIIAQGGATAADRAAVARVDELSARMNAFVHGGTSAALEDGRLPVLLGGDHSTPFGAIQACSERFPGLGVLQIDAHADLRVAYEGFRWSHASICHNVLEECAGVARLVQVGIRDLGRAEHERMQSDARIHGVFDSGWSKARRKGRMMQLVRETIDQLPRDVYLTFDVDGLDPTLCPGTGTPVPGGLLWDEAMLLLRELAKSGRRIVGLDLNEVSAGPEGDADGASWDAMIGARLLYRLIGFAVRTQPQGR
ncbi:MAG: agmatinase family protein [Planctomycetota bacterium]